MSFEFDVCILGLGHVGLPLACVMAGRGLRVLGVDIDEGVRSHLALGDAGHLAGELNGHLDRALSAGRLRVAATPESCSVFVLAVPTPTGDDCQPDLSSVWAAVDSLAPFLQAESLVLVESTIPVGTTEQAHARLLAARPDLAEQGGVRVAHSPERILPGRIIKELTTLERVVGGVDEGSTERAVAFYGSFLDQRLWPTDARTAEFTKLVENAYRDVNIAFANEISMLCEKVGLDARLVRQLANRHPRVDILEPGVGVGGHCVPVDTYFLLKLAEGAMPLVRAARAVNRAKEQWVVDQVLAAAAGLERPKVACLGLSYKADVADLRESPALAIVRALAARLEGWVVAADPVVTSPPDDVEVVDLVSALDGADLVVALVPHQAFAGLSLADLEGKIVIDPCSLFRRSS
jgi:UDP-N-acetyl-D-mannosaminuronic acid dehydrogenase